MTSPETQGPHSQAASAVQAGRPVEAQYVRQGRRGGRIMLILGASGLLALAALVVVWGVEAPRGKAAGHTTPAAASPANPATPARTT